MTTSRNLGPDELQAAEVKVLSLVQKERFEEELKLLEGKKLVYKTTANRQQY